MGNQPLIQCNVVTLNPSRCKFFIFVPEHYRKDGSCRCDDPAHRKMMIADWEYCPADFDDIPLKK